MTDVFGDAIAYNLFHASFGGENESICAAERAGEIGEWRNERLVQFVVSTN